LGNSNEFIFRYSYHDQRGRLVEGVSHVGISHKMFRKVLDFFIVVITDLLPIEIDTDEAYLEKFMTFLEDQIILGDNEE